MNQLPGSLSAPPKDVHMWMLRVLGPLLALVGVYFLFVALVWYWDKPSFLTVDTLELIARQTTTVGIAALGMTLVIIAGGIDLSVGSVMALTTVVIAWLLKAVLGERMPASAGWFAVYLWPLLAALAGIAAAALCGLVTGALVTGLRVVPFIVTLGMMLVVRGAAEGIARQTQIIPATTWLRSLLDPVSGQTRWLLVPTGVWLMLVLAVLTAMLLRYTRFGRHVYAVGSNELTARLCGVPVERVKILVFTLGGVFYGLGGTLEFSFINNTGDPTAAVGRELDVIAAVVIGGGSLAGGEGSVLGTIAGAAIMTVIGAGCSRLDLPGEWVQRIITGSVIIAAVALDRLRHRRAA